MSSVSSPRLGTVSSLWRYPVKSMRGEAVDAAEVTSRGIVGDRAYALIDADTGKVVSAKSPRKWGALLEFTATFVEPPEGAARLPPLNITLPDGTAVRSDQANVHQVLSRALGRPVTLVAAGVGQAAVFEEFRPAAAGWGPDDVVTDQAMALAAPAGTFFDFAALHLLTSASLRRLAAAYPQGDFALARFRPNVVVDLDASDGDFAENAWVHRTLVVGPVARVNVVMPCLRCVMTTVGQNGLPQDAGILRAIAAHNQVLIAPLRRKMPSVGVYAMVERGGRIRVGDPVAVGNTPLRRAGVFWLRLARNALRSKLRGGPAGGQ